MKRFGIRMAVALAVLAMAQLAAVSPARAAGPVDLTTGISNGALGAPGAMDDNWLVAKTPTPAPNRNFVINKHPAWVTPPAGSAWVNPYGAGDGDYTQAPSGDYQYYRDFCLVPGTEQNAFLSVLYSSDNGIEFSLNGVPIGGNPSQYTFQNLHPLSYAGPAFKPGMNRLVADVVNLHVVHGFLVQGAVDGAESCAVPRNPVASCRAIGVLVEERDSSGLLGNARLERSASTAGTVGAPAASAPDRTPPATPPSDPSASSDAKMSGLLYDNSFLGVSVSASEVYSRCDVSAHQVGDGELFTEAYGRAGAEDLVVKTPLGDLRVRVLDLALKALGDPGSLTGEEACTTLRYEPMVGPVIDTCTFDSQSLLGLISITLNERWGTSSGAALHISINTPVAIDIYVGLVEVNALSLRDW